MREFSKPVFDRGFHGAIFHESFAKVRGDDAEATFILESFLLLGSQQVGEFLGVFRVGSRKPKIRVGTMRIFVRHAWVDRRQVEAIERQVANVAKMLCAEVAPPVWRPRIVSAVVVRRLVRCPAH